MNASAPRWGTFPATRCQLVAKSLHAKPMTPSAMAPAAYTYIPRFDNALRFNRRISGYYFASASRLSFAQALSRGTAFSGGPPFVPQAQGPSVLASVMQEQDFVFRQAQTYTKLLLLCAWLRVAVGGGFC